MSAFYLDGIYSQIPIQSYLILDFRETKTIKKLYPNTWYIKPTPDFLTLNILTKNQ